MISVSSLPLATWGLGALEYSFSDVTFPASSRDKMQKGRFTGGEFSKEGFEETSTEALTLMPSGALSY